MEDYKVNIETNGAVDITPYLGKCLITMDYKTPSSGMEKHMLLDNLEKLGENDVLKLQYYLHFLKYERFFPN